jgi:hypothetical protein
VSSLVPSLHAARALAARLVPVAGAVSTPGPVSRLLAACQAAAKVEASLPPPPPRVRTVLFSSNDTGSLGLGFDCPPEGPAVLVEYAPGSVGETRCAGVPIGAHLVGVQAACVEPLPADYGIALLKANLEARQARRTLRAIVM